MVTTVPATLRAFFLSYAEHFGDRGWTVDAATREGPVGPRVTAAFGQVHGVPWSRGVAVHEMTAAGRRMAALLPGYDVVHTHTPIASFVTRLAAGTLRRDTRPAVVYTAHGFHTHRYGRRSRNTAFTAAERLAGPWTDRLVVLTEEDRRLALRHRLVPPDRLVLIPGVGIDLDHYAPTPALIAEAERMRARLGVPLSARLHTAVAALDPEKNHLAALRAVASLGPDHHLVCAGPGPEEARLVAEAEGLGVRQRLHLLGAVADVRPVVLASTSMVLPSRREGLSRAVMEALALGVPVVGADVRGIKELVAPDSGVLVAPDDVVGLARGLLAAEGFPPPRELRARLEPRLQQLALPAVLKQHERLYADALSDVPTAC